MGRFAKIKSVLAVALAVMMLFSMTACNNTQSENANENVGTNSETTVLTETADMLTSTLTEPTFGSVAGDWVALGLSRMDGEVPQEWIDSYYSAVETYVTDCDGVLDSRKYTEYSRLILALGAIGKDPANVAGYNMLAPLSDYEQTIFQGVNGPVYALLALDSGDYEIPENTYGTTQATREMYVDYILSKEIPGGGWSLAGGEVEIDITAMALQALSAYQDRQDVADAIDRGLTVLSEQQNESGGYTAFGVDSSESISQVIIALSQLDISVDDERFVKNGHTLEDRLIEFRTEDHGFKHLIDGEIDFLATQQAFLALVAVERQEKGQTGLYDYSDNVVE